MRRLFLGGALFLLVVVSSATAIGEAQDQLVLAGRPTAKVESDAQESIRSTLSTPASEEFRVEIAKRNGRYFWATRDNRELSYSQSGVYHIFREASGPGYIKVVDQASLPELLRVPGPRIQYYEHLTIGLATLTYWGSSQTFSP